MVYIVLNDSPQRKLGENIGGTGWGTKRGWHEEVQLYIAKVVSSPTRVGSGVEPRLKTGFGAFELELTYMVTTNFVLDTFGHTKVT